MRKVCLCLAISLLCPGCGQQPQVLTQSDTQTAQEASLDAIVPTSESVRPDTVTLALTGDIMMGTLFPTPKLPADSGRHIFDAVRDLLTTADVAAGNLEGVLADSGRSRKDPEKEHAYAFLMPTYLGQQLVRAGYDFAGIANNHIYDFYEEGISATERNLKALGMGFAGACYPRGKQQAATTCIVERNGVRFGFCAFSHERYTCRMQDDAAVKRTLKDLRGKCDILVVCFHGGAEGKENRHLPHGTEYFQGDDRGDLRAFAHLCIDNGADVVYGHGPHVVRAMELYKGRFIAYSLGNFCTVAGISLSGISGYAPLVRLTLNGKGELLSGKIHSFIQQPYRGPQRDPSNAVAKEIRTLTSEDCPDSGLLIAPDGQIAVKK